MAYAVRTFDGPPPIFELTEEATARAADFFKLWGFVIVRVLDQPQCSSLIREQWRKIIRTQPWEAPIRVFGPRADLDLDLALGKGDSAELMDVLINPLSVAQRKEFARAWPFHRGFGACCDPSTFHLPGVWAIRQDERLYKLACAVTGTDDLWVDVNRSVNKLPGEGEDEFLHFDAPVQALRARGAAVVWESVLHGVARRARPQHPHGGVPRRVQRSLRRALPEGETQRGEGRS
jgi:hypothetical protein